ncbi:MAG: sulfatase [Planctomycetota bacterium]|jgi:hypothetical protein
MTTSEPVVASHRPKEAGDVLSVLRTRLRHTQSQQERLRVLDVAQEAQPWLEHELERALAEVAEKDVMFDDALRLVRIWLMHRQGREAERDYYLHAFQRPTDRHGIREGLGIACRSRAEEVVLLITVDCLRADRLSCNGHVRPTSPTIDSLAADGVNFSRAYSTAGQTAQSFPGIFMSNFFQNFGCGRTVPDHLTTLADVMSANGFHCVGINAANPHVSHFYGYDRGFDEFYDFLGPENFNYSTETFTDDSAKRMAQPTEQELAVIFEDCQAHPDVYAILRELTGQEGMPMVRRMAARRRFYPYGAADMVQAAIAGLLRNADSPRQFYWLHLMDLHENITVPYSRVGEFGTVQQFFLNTLLASPLGLHALMTQADKYRELYDSAISHVDMNVQVLLNFLNDHGLLERSLICLTADHGKELLESGAFGHGYDRLREGVVHVPLVFSGGLGKRVSAEACDRPVSTLDIAPTIVDVCGIAEKPRSFLGTSLNDTRPRPVYGQTFYDGADNKCADQKGRNFELKPFPGPVKESCKEMLFCVHGTYQVIHDTGQGRTEVSRLRSAQGSETPCGPPDAELLTAEARAYLASAYAPPEGQAVRVLSQEEAETMEFRLRDLGYL